MLCDAYAQMGKENDQENIVDKESSYINDRFNLCDV